MSYYGFINQNIQRVIEEEMPGHIIFNSQRGSDRVRLESLLKDRNEIVVSFDDWREVIPLLYQIKDKKTQLKATRQYVSAKILQPLEERYSQIKEWEGSNDLDVFKQNNLELYEKKRALNNLTDVENLMSMLDINIDRMYFIVYGEILLCEALSFLLRDETPFKVTIFSVDASFCAFYPDSDAMELLSDVYSYTSFNKGEEGKPSSRLSDGKKGKR